MKGVPLFLISYNDSIVCFSRPCMRSTTRMARSHRLEPLDLKLVKDSCPGVSMIKYPGILRSKSILPFILTKCSFRVDSGKYVAPIC
jgi:hypothetical protein